MEVRLFFNRDSRLFTVPYFFVRSSRYSASHVPRGRASGIIALGVGGARKIEGL